MKKRKNKLTNAQTTYDASFGPVVVVAAFYVVYSISYNLYVLISINKTRKDRRKLTNNPNDAVRATADGGAELAGDPKLDIFTE